jgi:hypothetical protein
MATQYTAGLTTGEVLTAATMNSIGAAMETWTPTIFSGAGQATTSVANGFYFRINKMAFVIVQIKTNGAGSAGPVEIRGIPAAIAPKRTGSTNNSNQADIGAGQFFDAGTAAYLGAAYCFSSTAIRMYLSSSVDLALTIASGDAMQVNMVWEIA